MTRVIIISLLVCFSSLACVLGVVQQKVIAPSEPPAHTMPPVGSTETAVPPSPPTWTTYTNGNDVNDLAFDQEGNLWTATSGGLVKWTADGTYTKYTTSDGLPDNDVDCIAVASDGVVWLGTSDSGLVRFDPAAGTGKGWSTFTTADGLPDSRVWDVAVAANGAVWLSTYGSGVSHFDPAAGSESGETRWTTYTTVDGLPSNDVYGIAAANDSTAWAITAGCNISRFDPTAGSEHDGAKWTSYTINDDAYSCPSTIAIAPDDTVWVPTGNDLAHFDDVDWQTYTNDDLDNIYSIAVADDGSVWGTSQYGIFHFEGGSPDGDSPNGAWTTYPIAQAGDLLRNIALAPDGSIWASRHIFHENTLSWIGSGISRFDPSAGSEHGGNMASGEAWTTFTTDDELAANRVDHTVKTADGMLWFFTEGGVSCRGGEGWITCPGDGMGVTIGPSVTLSPDGTLWNLTYRSVSRFDGTSWTTYDSEDGLPGNSPGNLTITPDGAVWVGTYTYPLRTGNPKGDGAARFDGAGWTVYTTADGLANDFVNDIAVAADGTLWFATYGGVSRFDPAAGSGPAGSRWTTYTIDTILSDIRDSPHNYVRRIITTPDGLVCCELAGAVSCFDGESWTAYTQADGLYAREGIGLNSILSTAVDQDGALWLGTNEGGVSRFDGTSWTTYTTADGLAGDQINTIAVAPDGAVWVGTLNGASRFDGSTWTTFTTADGAPSVNNGIADNIVNDIVVAPDGSLWFSTRNGVSRYGPPE